MKVLGSNPSGGAMQAVMFLLGLILMIASIWAGQYLVYNCKDEWYALSAIITVWAVRLIAFGMMAAGLVDDPPKGN